MSLANAKLFLEKVVSDDDLRKDVQEKEYDEIVTKAKALGYDFSAEELISAVNEYRKDSGNTEINLDPQDLDTFAGGLLWTGEDASDGHEMGCLVSYHHKDWCMENKEYCSKNHYCNYEYYTL